MQPVPLPRPAARAFKRRSTRVQLKIRITIVVGDESVLNGETTTVSRHGARIRVTSTPGKLSHGEHVRVALRKGQRPQEARVVWLDKRSASHYGIELDEALGDFWGVYFPSKEDGEARRTAKKAPRTVGDVPLPDAVQPPPASQLAAEPKPAPALEENPALTLPAELGRIPAMVAGLSAIKLPFAEKIEFVFTHPQEGTALLQNIVEPGATLRITFAHRVTKGYVLAVAGQREEGRWRVRMKCDAASA